jgi:hypothetical protein
LYTLITYKSTLSINSHFPSQCITNISSPMYLAQQVLIYVHKILMIILVDVWPIQNVNVMLCSYVPEVQIKNLGWFITIVIHVMHLFIPIKPIAMGGIILMLVNLDESSINKFNPSLEQRNMCSQSLLSTTNELMQNVVKYYYHFLHFYYNSKRKCHT